MPRLLALGIALLLLLPGPVGAAGPGTRPAPAADPGCWTVFSDLGAASDNSFLNGLAAIAPDDVWAVGQALNAQGRNRPLTLHWDGATWREVPVPDSTRQRSLTGVAAHAGDDVWAVGTSYSYPGADTMPLVLHWDGHAWNATSTTGLEGATPLGVAVPAEGSPWVVGYSGGDKPLLAHWDGQAWRPEALPATPQPVTTLQSITAGPGGELWAAGGPAILHYDGARWEYSTGTDLLRVTVESVAVTGNGEVWAAGSFNPLDTQPQNDRARATLIEHRTGGSWSRVASANAEYGSYLKAIAAPRPDEVWAVGYEESGDRHNPTYKPILEHWDGAAWSLAPSPITATVAQWNAAAAVPGGDLWIAGTYKPGDNAGYRPLIARHATGACSQTFPETGKTVSGLFLDYWQQHGGLAQQGYPISGEFQEVSPLNGKLYTVQYFERAVFEAHPENTAPFNVLLSQLGTFQYKKKYPNGAPNQAPNKDDHGRLFTETGHWVGGKFRDYWESHGGLAQQGYPLSDEFPEKSDLNGQTYIVQYFERAIFEYHPEIEGTPYVVLLSQLGTFRGRAQYPQGFPQP